MAGRAAALVLIGLLAGCAAPAPPRAPPFLPPGLPSLAAAGGTYAFDHGGGVLALEAQGSAQVDLWSPLDERVGQLLVGGAAGPSLRLDGLEPGTYVLRALFVNGTLTVRSGATAAALRPLSSHVERHVLAQEPAGLAPAPPFGLAGGGEAAYPVDLRLAAPPLELRLLAAASASGLAVELRNQGQAVLARPDRPWGGLQDGLLLSPPRLWTVDAEAHPERVRSGHLEGVVATRGFSGVLVLESYGYSRAEAPRLPAAPAGDVFASATAAFSYGPLPDGPVSFQTGPRATHLLLTPSPGGNLTLVLFAADGRRLGLATADGATGPVAVRVAPAASYLAYRAAGNGSLGADDAPGDFQLHPVATRTADLPSRAPGDGGAYGQEAATVPGIVLDAWPVHVGGAGVEEPFGSVSPCSGDGSVRVLSGNATVGYWGFGDDLDKGVAGRLSGGPLRVVADGFGGDGCKHPAARVLLAEP